MKIWKKIISMLLAVVMAVGALPVSAFAAEGECVYLSVSFDGAYIDDQYGEPMVYVPVPMAEIKAVDLAAYGLDHMRYDSDDDGAYETTALQLLIYAHEELYGGDWSEVTFDALPGSSYFDDGIFGFTENLVYFHNGDFPVDSSQTSGSMTVGATSDRIVLEAGDFLDVASFSCYSFLWDEAGGFHLFADEAGNYVHDYTVEAGEPLPVRLIHSFCDLMFGRAWLQDAADYEVSYGAVFGEAEGSVCTDDSGRAEITFPEAGTYYLWCCGDHSEDPETHTSCDHYLETGEPCIVSAPAYAKVTVTETQTTQPRQPQDVTEILNATMEQLAETVTAPTFGTNAGEWTVFSLARGNYFAKNASYFTDYYDRIVETVNGEAAEVNLSGALHKSKSTENSRLIVALSAIGKDATAVGDWNLVEAYDANGLNWIKKQGLNGTIWALLALDSNNYQTADETLRQQCVNALLDARHNDGGWSLVTNKAYASNVDITGMALTALYPYRRQTEVAAACEEAIAWLSDSQLATGGFPYGTGETSESCAWAIVALSTWGINPDTDSRFIKNGNSAVDNLLTYYIADEAMFAHQGKTSNNMATDQCCYALVAYNRLLQGETSLFDYSDVTFPSDEQDQEGEQPEEETPGENTSGENTGALSVKIAAALGLPSQINPGSTFNGTISVDNWENQGRFKLVDYIVTVPNGVAVTSVKAGSRLSGGEVVWNLESDTGKLRVVYFDANKYSDLTISGETFPAELFTIGFRAEQNAPEKLNIAVTGMSVKSTSGSNGDGSMVVVDTAKASGVVTVVTGTAFSAVSLYQGDDVDLIPAGKQAVAVAVTDIAPGAKLEFRQGDAVVEFRYSPEITEKTGISSYVALVDAALDMNLFVAAENYTIGEETGAELTFGDGNGDGMVNAQDALAAVNAWLRKGQQPTDVQILAMNVNGDSRINTFDAMGIVEAYVNNSTYAVVTAASGLAPKQE